MTTGTLTYKGLAVPLHGESDIKQITASIDILTITGATSQSGDSIVCRDVDGTENFWVNADGGIYSRADVSATAYVGLDARGSVAASSTGAWFCTIGARLTSANTTNGAQQYALMGRLITTGTNTGGRDAVLSLSYSWGNSMGAGECAFIDFSNENTDVPTLFSFHNFTADESGGMFVTNTNANTHAFKIYIGDPPTLYYLMVADSHS